MPTAAIKTLGCKLNQYESQQMREQLLRLGYTIVDVDCPADLYIVNSCTVTHHADSDTRRLARRAKRLNPHAYVVVTGCYPQVARQELAAIPEIDLVCDQAEKARLADVLPEALRHADATSTTSPHDHLVHQFAEHTRCFIKVQEGCNARCSYCIIPDARGPSRSVALSEVIEQARELARAGHPELVLIGTHLGQYGRDLEDDIDLTGLLLQLAALPEVQRLRLSSIEPCEVTDELISLIAGGGRALDACCEGSSLDCAAPKLCRYLHIPLQSGSNTVLQRMRRPYTSESYAALIQRMHDAQAATGLGTDVIVGFPGETDEEFEQTRELLTSLPLSYLHVFTYSPRRGTPAASMPDQVPYQVALERNHVLRELSERKRESFARQMIGQTLETVLQTDEGDGWLRGVTDNYLQLQVQAPKTMLNSILACTATDLNASTLIGEIQT
ncbi:MAG: tRNA (N(6)-L-threonylcarbamoyladenosine(37)-C(2))-methylthiotransferase MtaB [Armatimonadia bacterium]